LTAVASAGSTHSPVPGVGAGEVLSPGRSGARAFGRSGVLVERFRAYWELTKPGITRLVVVTAAAGFYLASASFDWLLFINAMIGIGLVAGGTNALNQWAERDADARMNRTLRRPLPSGRLTSGQALGFSAGIAIVGLAYLAAFVNLPTTLLVACSLLSYIFVYTPLKRRTWFATIIGAVPGALPILAGWTASGSAVDARAVVLFLILFVWQMPHFYALAWLYREDYRRGGFQMLTVVDPTGKRAARQAVLYAAALVGLSVLPTTLGLAGQAYLLGALLLGTAFLVLGMGQLRTRSEARARQLFLGSVVYLPLLLVLMVIDRVS
jgi:protoheme IX farnesyltransferase